MAECIISTAQHASPNVKGQSDPERDQLIRVCSFVKNQSNFKNNSTHEYSN